jgi:hypothetical protein
MRQSGEYAAPDKKEPRESPRLSSNREASNRVDRSHSEIQKTGLRKVTLAALFLTGS